MNTGTKTGTEAFLRVALARMGSTAEGATEEYLKVLRTELSKWLSAVDQRLAKMPSKSPPSSQKSE